MLKNMIACLLASFGFGIICFVVTFSLATLNDYWLIVDFFDRVVISFIRSFVITFITVITISGFAMIIYSLEYLLCENQYSDKFQLFDKIVKIIDVFLKKDDETIWERMKKI